MNGFIEVMHPGWELLAASSGMSPKETVDPLATGMIVAGVVFLGLLMTFSIRSRIARRAAEAPSPRERLEALKRQAAGRDDPDRERAVLLDETQRYAATLDNKARRLEMLLSEADQAIDQLTTLREQVRTLVERSRRQSSGDEPATAARSTTSDATCESTSESSAGAATATLASARAAVEALVPEIDTLVEPRDPLTASIYELADQGRSAVDIARALDEHTGKVELILALRRA